MAGKGRFRLGDTGKVEALGMALEEGLEVEVIWFGRVR